MHLYHLLLALTSSQLVFAGARQNDLNDLAVASDDILMVVTDHSQHRLLPQRHSSVAKQNVQDSEDESDDDVDAEPVSDSDSDTDPDDDEDHVPEPPKKIQKLLHMPLAALTCGKSPFTPDEVKAAITGGLEIVQKQLPQWQNKPREQPHYYNNREAFDFPDCTEGRMYEFPILIGGKVHKGGRTGTRAPPGAHRIIFKAEEDGGTFCGLITHEGAASRGSFVTCE